MNDVFKNQGNKIFSRIKWQITEKLEKLVGGALRCKVRHVERI
jgi:hypothetical protein